jgi:hypothetical protein
VFATPLAGLVVETATTISVTTIARIPSPIGTRPNLARRPDAQRKSTDPAAMAIVPKISANEGIQMENRRAKGAKASPRVVACPIPSHRERRVEAAIRTIVRQLSPSDAVARMQA